MYLLICDVINYIVLEAATWVKCVNDKISVKTSKREYGNVIFSHEFSQKEGLVFYRRYGYDNLLRQTYLKKER